VGETGYSTMERTWLRPTLDVHGMWGGYQEPGSKTVLPATFGAKVSMRLVPDQNPHEIFEHMKPYVEKLAPPGVTVKIEKTHVGLPFVTDPEGPALRAARRALERVWPNPPVMMREGGSVPVMEPMQRIFGAPFILMGFGLDDDQVHAPNEKFSLGCYFGGIRSVASLYEELGGL
jgi:amidohydrolase